MIDNHSSKFLSEEVDLKANQAAKFMKHIDGNRALLVKSSGSTRAYVWKDSFNPTQNDVNIKNAIQRGLNIFYSSSSIDIMKYRLPTGPLAQTYRN